VASFSGDSRRTVDSAMTSLSIIIPVMNEAENIAQVHQEIVQVCEANGYRYEIIIVDDGSSDRTGEVAAHLTPVKLICFQKNFGQTAAMDAGISHSRYNYIVTMDGDRQNDPHDIPRLLKHLEKNDLDAVAGWRVNRRDNTGKRLMSRGANFLRSVLLKDGIHDSGCSLKVFKRSCFDHLRLYGEMHRFIPALLKIKGFRIGELEVNHRPRLAGRTKYDWRRTIKGFVDILSVWFWNKYAVRPLHLLGGGGLVCLLMGMITIIYTFFLFLGGEDMSSSAFPLLAAFLTITGIQLFISGLLADVMMKIYFEKTNDTAYTIKEIIENGSAPTGKVRSDGASTSLSP